MDQRDTPVELGIARDRLYLSSYRRKPPSTSEWSWGQAQPVEVKRKGTLLAVREDGLVVTEDGDHAIVWQGAKKVRTLALPDTGVNAREGGFIAGRLFVKVGEDTDDGTIHLVHLLDVDRGRSLGKLSGHGSDYTHLAPGASGKAVTDNEDRLRVVDIAANRVESATSSSAPTSTRPASSGSAESAGGRPSRSACAAWPWAVRGRPRGGD